MGYILESEFCTGHVSSWWCLVFLISDKFSWGQVRSLWTMDSIQLIQVSRRQHTTPLSQTGAMTKKYSRLWRLVPLLFLLWSWGSGKWHFIDWKVAILFWEYFEIHPCFTESWLWEEGYLTRNPGNVFIFLAFSLLKMGCFSRSGRLPGFFPPTWHKVLLQGNKCKRSIGFENRNEMLEYTPED